MLPICWSTHWNHWSFISQFPHLSTFPPAITTAWTSPVNLMMSGTSGWCEVQLKIQHSANVSELSQLYSVQKDEGGLCTRDLNDWYEWRRYCHLTGCNRGTRYTKQKYSIGDHILEGFGSFGSSLPSRLKTAGWFGHATAAPWPRSRVDASHNLRRRYLEAITNDQELGSQPTLCCW